jgi:hypothetical protein
LQPVARVGDNAAQEDSAMFRYSLLTLFGAILVISVGCAALVSASDLWAQAVVTATVLALLIATVGAIYLPGRSWGTNTRAFSGGFAIFGWAYLLLVQGPWFEGLKPQLATTVALNKLQRLMHEESDASPGQRFTYTSTLSANNVTLLTPSFVPTIAAPFHQIGQSLWAILLACVGGAVARAFGNRRLPPETIGAKA